MSVLDVRPVLTVSQAGEAYNLTNDLNSYEYYLLYQYDSNKYKHTNLMNF